MLLDVKSVPQSSADLSDGLSRLLEIALTRLYSLSDILACGLRMSSRNGLRFRGTFFPQPNGQHDDGEDGQKLALPILEGLEPELRGA